MFEIFVRFGRCTDFWDLFKWLAGAYKSSGCHTDRLQEAVLIRDEKFKWLDFGSTPDPVNLQPHAGYVWLKSGYSEAIPWRKVRLTKQRNVNLTTTGLWAMPFNEGWVLVKAQRLQDWEKLKKYVPVHKQGDVCPNEPCLKKAMQMMMLIQNKDDSPVQCHVCVHRPMCRAVLKNVTPPQTHTVLKWPFLTDFKKYTHTPPPM